jgi:uncharacterized protein YjbJ (UPF0337 family)
MRPGWNCCALAGVGWYGHEVPGPIAIGSHDKENQMNWDRIQGNWKQFTGKVKEQWGKLTDDDLMEINGSREKLEGKIQERYGLSKDQAREELDRWTGGQV